MQHKNNLNGYKRLALLIPLILVIIAQFSCKKYLDKKPRQNLAVPSSLKDLQAILDNQSANISSPGYLEYVADNYYLTSSTWSGADLDDRTNYIWDKNARITSHYSVWNSPYEAIYHANLVLDYLPEIVTNESERTAYNNIKGTALFYRAFMFHQLAQLFCKPYSTSSVTDPGIVLRLVSAVEAASTRSTVQQTYDQVIADLKIAAELLPVTTIFSTRPNKAAAYGMLARVYLSMRDYVNSEIYANAALDLNSTLLDYKSLNSSTLQSFINNPEILFKSLENSAPNGLFAPSNCQIDSGLLQSYNVNDLRRTVFFGSNTAGATFYWKGCYAPDAGSFFVFDGIATDEIYLVRAECRARTGDKGNAMADLNALLSKRYNGTFTADLDTTGALNKILTERRKELLFRGLRWSDLRRFNLEGANITLKRIINGITYSLPPNDLRWVLLIPEIEISRSGISQNPRN